MNFIVCSIVISALVISVTLARPEEKYTTKYDNVDLDEILKSDRLLKNYVNCLLEKGNCSPDGMELKRVLPDALESDCEKCNDKQKNGSRQVIRYLIKNKKDWWNELEAKYDSDKKYVAKYKDELAKEGIEL